MDNLNIFLEDINKEVIENIISRMVKSYKPLAIYLFGSYAWGKPEKNSDIDLFIIIDQSNMNQADRIRVGLSELTDINVAVDLLVFTKEEAEIKKSHPSTLTHKVFTKGVKIYEAA